MHTKIRIKSRNLGAGAQVFMGGKAIDWVDLQITLTAEGLPTATVTVFVDELSIEGDVALTKRELRLTKKRKLRVSRRDR